MKISKPTLSLTIRSRLLLLTGVILMVLIESNLYMRAQIVVGTDVLLNQARLYKVATTATTALRAFGELKYWLTDLEVSWLNESEDMAGQARADLDKHLQTLSAFAPDEVAEVRRHVGKFVDLSTEAVDAYMDENRVLGNSLVAGGRESILAVDVILVKIAEGLREQAARAEVAATAAADQTVQISIAILIAGTALAIFLTWATLRSVLIPLKSMTVAVTKLAGGDTTVDVPALGEKDEIGEMAKGIEVFKDNAIEIKRLEEEKVERERRAEEDKRKALLGLADTLEQGVKGVVDAVSSGSAEMKSAAESMASTAEETSRQSGAAAAASEQATANVQTVSAAAEEMSASVNEIARQVAQSAAMAKAAVEEAQKTNVTVQGLAEGSQKIGEVVEMISDIANQTNLLALNATIEAARAGDAGKGFAVVASEVKSLANQTAKATEQISAQIAAIQSSTDEAVGAIKGIGEKISEMDEVTTAIASAIEEQGASTGEISNNSQQAAIGTQEVSENITAVNRAATETGAAAGQVLQSAAELSSQAEKLRTEVDKFLTEVREAA